MEIRTLQWDSDFFGLRIGRVDIQTKADALSLSAQHNELRQQFDLLYVFDTNNVGFEAEGALLVDEKILYSKPCEPRKQYSEIAFYQGATPSADLYRLALVSGGYSRFKLDERLPKGSYERLYNRWIENACPKEGTNKQILTFLDTQGTTKGMITIDYTANVGHIGLVAVDSDAQHQGIGGKIMSTLDGYLFDLGVKTLEVPTQKNNIDACRWYEKNGFAIQSVLPIYHWWL
ncbi:MAG: GNAT family N-acetyltransferase [Paludibacteraceae bacterium]|nr:GNAT family N-acetyltransferase [Paludibacteraceae bacterium]